jgi:hypothetical protein
MGILHENQYTFFILSLSVLLRMRNISEKVVEEIKTKKMCRLWDNGEKYGRARHATDDNMVYSHCVLDT